MGYPGINDFFKKKLQVMQNKMVRFILKLDSRAHIGNDELVRPGFLSVVDRVKQLKLGHVFKIKNKSCPIYDPGEYILPYSCPKRTGRKLNIHLIQEGNKQNSQFYQTKMKIYDEMRTGRKLNKWHFI